MERELLRKVQLAQLEIAKDIKRVCDENDIHYFLSAGTLLGAIRHKGFIPWDDDMDFGMLREDYDKFISIAQEKLGDRYFLQTWDTDEQYPLPFSKVRKVGTVFAEATTASTLRHKELFVDVLPYDELPRDSRDRKKVRRKIFFWCRLLYSKDKVKTWMHHENKLYRFLSMCRFIPFIICSHFFSREKIKSKCSEVMRKHNGENTGFFYEQWGDLAGKIYVSADCFSTYVDVPFESTTFKVPQGYEEILRARYGDYMQLPPEDQRENRHKVLEVKL